MPHYGSYKKTGEGKPSGGLGGIEPCEVRHHLDPGGTNPFTEKMEAPSAAAPSYISGIDALQDGERRLMDPKREGIPMPASASETGSLGGIDTLAGAEKRTMDPKRGMSYPEMK